VAGGGVNVVMRTAVATGHVLREFLKPAFGLGFASTVAPVDECHEGERGEHGEQERRD
jgi:hypothetical protein